MNKCCHNTFILALEEVSILIKQKNIEDINQLVKVIRFYIKELKENEDENRLHS